MAGPVPRKYSAGSIIYFENDVGDEIYVLQKGRVMLNSTSLESGEDVKEEVRRGEFFGVKSAVGHYPREETAQVLTETLILVFKVNDFEALCLKNARIVIQMLKVFSANLRKIHKTVRNLLGEHSSHENSVELMKVAEYYYKNNQTQHAKYALQAYLQHYPAGKLAGRARRLSETLSKGNPYPIDIPELEDELANSAGGPAPAGGDDFSAPPPMGDMDEPPPLDDFDESPDDTGGDEDASTIYYDGLNYFSQGDFDSAIQRFGDVLALQTVAGADLEFVEKALYDQGRAYLKKGKPSEAISKFSTFLKKHPKSPIFKKAVLGVAEGYEAKKDIQRAAQLYAKAAKIPPQDKDSSKAAAKLKELSK